MNPEKQAAYEPNDPMVGDRLFSQLPFEDRWRLIKEALHESKEPFNKRRVPLSVIGALTLGIAVSASPYNVTAPFRLWLILQFIAISVLLFLGRHFRSEARKKANTITRSLSDVEEAILSKSGESGRHTAANVNERVFLPDVSTERALRRQER